MFQAHQLHRRAEGHLRSRRFDKAIQCHHKASEKLEEAMKLTKVTRALESLQLQQDYHNRQEEIIKLKKQQFEMYKKALENQHQKATNVLGKHEQPFDQKELETSNLQIAIYRNMEEADSLLELLVQRESDGDSESIRSEAEDVTRLVTAEEIIAPGPSPVLGSKRPKDDRVVIEELRMLNMQLRTLVMQLMVQLDACACETDRLRQRVHVLEAGQAVPTVRKTSLHVITDSTGGNSSPFVFSPCGELSPDVTETHITRELPVLAPLEMPNFDFSIFMRQPSEGEH